MSIGSLDLAILLAYVAATLLFGVWIGRGQRTASDYLLGGRNLPWWALLISIVSRRTATATVLAIIVLVGLWIGTAELWLGVPLVLSPLWFFAVPALFGCALCIRESRVRPYAAAVAAYALPNALFLTLAYTIIPWDVRATGIEPEALGYYPWITSVKTSFSPQESTNWPQSFAPLADPFVVGNLLAAALLLAIACFCFAAAARRP